MRVILEISKTVFQSVKIYTNVVSVAQVTVTEYKNAIRNIYNLVLTSNCMSTENKTHFNSMILTFRAERSLKNAFDTKTGQ